MCPVGARAVAFISEIPFQDQEALAGGVRWGLVSFQAEIAWGSSNSTSTASMATHASAEVSLVRKCPVPGLVRHPFSAPDLNARRTPIGLTPERSLTA